MAHQELHFLLLISADGLPRYWSWRNALIFNDVRGLPVQLALQYERLAACAEG